MKEFPPSLICPNCSHENLNNAKFCQNCGQPLARTCARCGTSNEPNARFCQNCGKALVLVSPTKEKTRLAELQGSAPKGLQEKMRASSSQIEGERKPVTILFTDIVGSTEIAEKLDPEEWKEIVSGAHRRVSEAIYRYEGTVAQLLGDGVLAFFGAPITHEDDPIRAVHAALDILKSIANYGRELSTLLDNFQIRIGINTGEVVVGNIGTDMHMEYLALGDAVNVAARLQSAAKPGRVLLSETCARLVMAEFDLKDPAKIEAKGKEEQLSVVEVVGVRTEDESWRGIRGIHSPLVGREVELDLLKESLISLCRGHGQIVAVTGEAGIGKSRLYEEIRILAAKDLGITEEDDESESVIAMPSSLRWLEGRALSYGSSLSFWTITQLLQADIGLSDGAPELRVKVVLHQRVNQLFSGADTDTLPFLSHLLGLTEERETEEYIHSFDSETLKRQTMKSLSDYFTAVAKEMPTVLVFEDMHWADPSSLEAIGELLSLSDLVPIMILILMRIDPDHNSWDTTIKANRDFAHRYKEIHLKPLSSLDSEHLVSHLLGIQQLPEEIRGLILTRSEGNPFYLEEVIHHLVEQRLIVKDDQVWRMTQAISEFGIPDTLRGVLLARIDRLEEEVRRTLQLASVIGRSFLYRLLKAITEAERELDKHLSQLQRVDLVHERARVPELEYIFKHSLTQEAAYNSLLHERRREFHLKVGEALERLFTDRKDEFLGLLAHHFEAAESVESAVDYLIQAGDKARWEDALEEASGYYHRALKLILDTEDVERASQTWLKLGLISMANFDFDDAHRANEAAFALEQKAKSRRISGVEIDQQPHEPPRNLRIVCTGQSGNLDPGTSGWVLETQIISQIFAGLAELDSETNVIPHVARSWEVLDGGKRYLFHLRDDVYWTDGSQVTAEDFEWAWIRNLTILTASYLPRILDDVVGAQDYRMGRNSDPKSVGVRALDPTTLEVRLTKPVAYFIYLMTSPVTYPLPRAVIERYGEEWWKPEHIISNGAFQLVDYDDEHITLIRNPDYFTQFTGNLERIEWSNKPEVEARLAELNTGNADSAWNIPPRLIPEETPHEQIHSHAYSLSLRYLIFNPRRAPLNDVKVRRALAHALDRRLILEVAVGHGTSPASGIIPAGMPGHSPELGLGSDVRAAQRYLAEAGYPGGEGFPQVNIAFIPASLNLEIISEIVRQWEEGLGIEVIFNEIPVELDWPPSPEVHARVHGWAADYTDPDSFLRQSNIIDTLKYWGWENERYQELVELAANTPNRTHRMAMYRQADRFLVEDEVLIVPIWYGGIWSMPHIIRPLLKDYRRNALGYVRFKDVILERDSRLTE